MLQIPTLRNLNNLYQRAVSLILPPTCISCQDVLAPTEPLGLCPTCWQTLPRWNLETTPTPRLPQHLDSFHAPFLYEGTARDLILQFKFADKPEFAPALASFLRPQLDALLIKCEKPLLIPVPLHPARLRKRLYNQAALLVQHLVKNAPAPQKTEKIPYNLTSALIKVVNTKPQGQKSAKARQKLPKLTFFAHELAVIDHDVIIIDDIYTTGSTLNAAAAQLKKAGAKSVHALTLAYTQPS